MKRKGQPREASLRVIPRRQQASCGTSHPGAGEEVEGGEKGRWLPGRTTRAEPHTAPSPGPCVGFQAFQARKVGVPAGRVCATMQLFFFI